VSGEEWRERERRQRRGGGEHSGVKMDVLKVEQRQAQAELHIIIVAS